MNFLMLTLALVYLPYQQFDVVLEDGSTNFPPKAIKLPNNKDNDYFLVVNDQIEPLKEPKSDSKVSGAPKIKFGTAFRLVKEAQTDAVYWLICTVKNNNTDIDIIYGWINTNWILSATKAMTVDEGNPISRKALIINSSEWVKKNGNKLPVPLLGFLEDSEKKEPIRFFNIMFVYKDITSKDPKIGQQLLVGFDPLIANNLLAGKTLAGWLPVENLCLWNTREAIQWNDGNKQKDTVDDQKRKNKGHIFRTKEDLITFCNDKSEDNKKDPKGLLASEIIDNDGFSVPWRIDQPRYPKLSLPKEEIDLGTGFGKLYKVGFIGSFKNDKGDFIDSDKMEEYRNLADMIKKHLEETYILFVIDDTSSMEKAFNDIVPKCIENVIKTVKDANKVKVAVCFYNDFNNAALKIIPGSTLDSTVQFHNWEPLTKGLGSPIVEMLKKHPTQNGGDRLEQPIHGLLRGLEKASEKIPKHSRKVVFVIGDNGNHVKDNLGQNLENDSKLIAKLLTPVNSSPWDFLPIQVPHPDGGEAAKVDEDYKLYETQMNNIHALVKIRREESLKNINDLDLKAQIKPQDIGKTINVRSYDDMLTELNKRTNLYEEKKQTIESELNGIIRGNFPPGSQFSSEVSEALSNEKIDVSLLKSNGTQLFQEGWVSELDGDSVAKQQIKKMLLMEKLVFDGIITILDSFNGIIKNYSPERVAKGIAKGQTGDPFGTIEESLASLEGVSFKSNLLEYYKKQADINKNNQNGAPIPQPNPKQIQENILRLSLMYNIFKNLADDTKSVYKIINQANPGGGITQVWAKDGESIPAPRFFRLKGSLSNEGADLKFIWLDYDKEFP